LPHKGDHSRGIVADSTRRFGMLLARDTSDQGFIHEGTPDTDCDGTGSYVGTDGSEIDTFGGQKFDLGQWLLDSSQKIGTSGILGGKHLDCIGTTLPCAQNLGGRHGTRHDCDVVGVA
jgi:hypothetical protein